MTELRREPGEDLVTIDVTGTADPLFPAHVHDVRWNGWACPAFRRPVAEAVVEWINATAESYPDSSARAAWDGDTVVVTDPQYSHESDYAPERIGPDAHGRYGIGAFGWCWFVVTEDDRIPDTSPATEPADRDAAPAEVSPR